MQHHGDTKTVLVAGGTGFIGRQVAARLRAAGHRVVVLGRRADPPRDLAHAIDPSLFEGVDEGFGDVGPGVASA